MKRAGDFSGDYDKLPIAFTDNEEEKREARLVSATFDQDKSHYRLNILNPDGTRDSVLLHADTSVEVRE